MSFPSPSSAPGFDGDQALGVQLLRLGPRKRQLIRGEALPLSHRSHLTWLGFTAEGQRVFSYLWRRGEFLLK